LRSDVSITYDKKVKKNRMLIKKKRLWGEKFFVGFFWVRTIL